MADDHTLGVRGGAGREHDLCNVVTANCDRRNGPVGIPIELAKLPRWYRARIHVVPREHDPRVDDGADAIGEVA